MNNNIDFSDFHKISVEHPSKCRKITKHKFEIIAALTTIIIIILIIVYENKKKEKSEKNDELSFLKEEYFQIKINITNITNDINEADNIIKSLDNEKGQIDLDIKNNQSDLEQINKTNKKFKLIKKLLNNIELKLNMTQRLNNLQINYSNIQNNVTNFENEVSMKVKNKCYDSIVYGFSPQMFYKNCAGNALLFLIKTGDGERIGAYTSESKNENINIKDEKSMLINFDNNKFFKYNMDKTKDCDVIWNLNEFPKFGGDLEIYDEKGESLFPFCYGLGEDLEESEYFVKSYVFKIEILEIYKVEEN